MPWPIFALESFCPWSAFVAGKYTKPASRKMPVFSLFFLFSPSDGLWCQMEFFFFLSFGNEGFAKKSRAKIFGKGFKGFFFRCWVGIFANQNIRGFACWCCFWSLTLLWRKRNLDFSLEIFVVFFSAKGRTAWRSGLFLVLKLLFCYHNWGKIRPSVWGLWAVFDSNKLFFFGADRWTRKTHGLSKDDVVHFGHGVVTYASCTLFASASRPSILVLSRVVEGPCVGTAGVPSSKLVEEEREHPGKSRT